MTGKTALQESKNAQAIETLFPNTIRMLAADAAQKAGSGHPGAPMGLADTAWVLWDRFLKFNPDAAAWPDRDRFVLSAGHACLLLYSLLHLYGYDLPLEQLKNYRQRSSLTPGHPEFGHTPGVETTTGPLGQGVANAVGMALAERHLAARFNRQGLSLVDHRTWCICSDGDVMEGVASEAASLAGHLKLGKLTLIYDDNRITIGGSTSITFSEDVGARFEAYGWHVEHAAGHDHEQVGRALTRARDEADRPSLVMVRTHIGYGSPGLQDSPKVHGSPLGEEELKLTRANLGWPDSTAFWVPDSVYAHARQAAERGRAAHAAWEDVRERYRRDYPEAAAEFERVLAGRLPEGWDRDLPVFEAGGKAIATRSASGKVLNALAPRIPELIGGSADLEPSNKTLLESELSQSAENPLGRNVHFGIREHAMGAMNNGMAYHGGLRPYGGTFLVFSDYQRPAVRIAALAGLRVVFVYTHDSIGVGGDGPTHQPVEHIQSLRAVPGLVVIRPADANETRVAWLAALEQDGPVALILSRQDLPIVAGLPADRLKQGAYIAREAPGGKPDAIIMASGSELSVAIGGADRLGDAGLRVRVVSFPSWELFEAQPLEYRTGILPPEVTRRLAVEAGSTQGWWKYVGSRGDVMGVDRFGASGPGGQLMAEFGFTEEQVARRVQVLA